MWSSAGTTLGPLLFLLYVNYIVMCLIIFSNIISDATDVFIDGENVNNITVSMNKELHKLILWLNINKLSLNIGKTHFMIFRSNKRNCHFNRNLKINCQIITRVESIKHICNHNRCLTWREHIYNVKNSISRGLEIIW